MLVREQYRPDCTNIQCALALSCSRIPTTVARPLENQNENIDVLFIGDHPTSYEMLAKQPFTGPAREIIQRVFEKNRPEASYAFSYLVRGWPHDPKTIPLKLQGQSLTQTSSYDLKYVKGKAFGTLKKKKQILEDCVPFLQADIARLKPRLIVVLGKTVKDALFPQEPKTVTQLYNAYREYRGITTRFMGSVRSVVQNPSGKKMWTQQLAAVLTNRVAKKDIEPGEDFLVTDIQDALGYIEMLRESTIPISVDLETLNLNKRYGNKIATIQFAETTTTGVTIPFEHAQTPWTPDELTRLRKACFDLFNKPNSIPYWIGHNLKFECNLLASQIGTQILSAPIFDTQIAAFLVDENRTERAAEFKYGIYTLKQLAYDYCNFDGYDQGTLAQRSSGSLFDLNLESLSAYGAMDVYITYRLAEALLEEAEQQNYRDQLEKLMFHFYTPVLRLLSDVEQNGFYAEKTHLRKLVSKKVSPLLGEIKNIEAGLKDSIQGQKANALVLAKSHPGRIQPLAGMPWVFNLAKEGHPQTLFFDVLKLQKGRIGANGLASVDKEWQNHNKTNEFVERFMEWQSCRILYNTFAKKLYARIDPTGPEVDSNTDCRIRSNFILTGAVTGRLASRSPNLQNIPRGDTPVKKSIKNIFQAPKGEILVQLDYKANEVRWVGIMASDANLAKAINQGRELFVKYRENPTPEALEIAETYGDLHKQTASLLFDKDVSEITKDERQASKAVVFGLLYGSSVRAIAETHQKSLEEVQAWFDGFYERFPDIATWKTGMEQQAAKLSFVETPHGRRRRFPIFDVFREGGYFDPKNPAIENSGAASKIAECLRQSVNAPIQGIASDAGMLGAALFADYIREHRKPWVITNAVHDSCIYTSPPEALAESLEVAEKCFSDDLMVAMERDFGIHFNLPLEVEFELGLKWGELEKWNYSPEHLEELTAKYRS